MIKELGEVIRLENDFVWVQTIRQSTCGACQARHGCGQKLLSSISSQSADIRARLNPEVNIGLLSEGDQVEIGISEGAVVLSSMITYGLPIIALVAGAVAAAPLGSDLFMALSGFASLILAASCVRWVFPKLCYTQLFEPVVLNLETAVELPKSAQPFDAPR